jgi:hypothetical protein
MKKIAQQASSQAKCPILAYSIRFSQAMCPILAYSIRVSADTWLAKVGSRLKTLSATLN